MQINQTFTLAEFNRFFEVLKLLAVKKVDNMVEIAILDYNKVDFVQFVLKFVVGANHQSMTEQSIIMAQNE